MTYYVSSGTLNLTKLKLRKNSICLWSKAHSLFMNLKGTSVRTVLVSSSVITVFKKNKWLVTHRFPLPLFSHQLCFNHLCIYFCAYCEMQVPLPPPPTPTSAVPPAEYLHRQSSAFTPLHIHAMRPLFRMPPTTVVCYPLTVLSLHLHCGSLKRAFDCNSGQS